jgi:GNAT superfamily N-acetyltransferase
LLSAFGRARKKSLEIYQHLSLGAVEQAYQEAVQASAWLHVRTLAVAAPARGHGFGSELMKRAELYAVELGCTDAFLDTFSFQARPFYEKLGYRVFGMLENHPAGHQHCFMTKQL